MKIVEHTRQLAESEKKRQKKGAWQQRGEITCQEATVEAEGADSVDRDEENEMGELGRRQIERRGETGRLQLRMGRGFVNQRGWRRIWIQAVCLLR